MTLSRIHPTNGNGPSDRVDVLESIVARMVARIEHGNAGIDRLETVALTHTAMLSDLKREVSAIANRVGVTEARGDLAAKIVDLHIESETTEVRARRLAAETSAQRSRAYTETIRAIAKWVAVGSGGAVLAKLLETLL